MPWLLTGSAAGRSEGTTWTRRGTAYDPCEKVKPTPLQAAAAHYHTSARVQGKIVFFLGVRRQLSRATGHAQPSKAWELQRNLRHSSLREEVLTRVWRRPFMASNSQWRGSMKAVSRGLCAGHRRGGRFCWTGQPRGLAGLPMGRPVLRPPGRTAVRLTRRTAARRTHRTTAQLPRGAAGEPPRGTGATWR